MGDGSRHGIGDEFKLTAHRAQDRLGPPPLANVAGDALNAGRFTVADDEPAIVMKSVHHLYKIVNQQPLVRPAWFFDIAAQGEGITDVTTHLVDLAQWMTGGGNPFDYDKDVAPAQARLGKMFDAFDPDLDRMRRRGAKLIVYHGWNDPSISPLNTINYYESVVSRIRGTGSRDDAERQTQEFFRLFMVPGMLHCSQGPGPNSFDMLTALDNWVEKGIAPDQVVASHSTGGVVDRTRPLCVYPKVAVHSGRGGTDDAANFVCRLPES